MKHKIILALSILTPPILMQIWQANFDILNKILFVYAIFFVAFIISLIIGIRQRNIFSLLALPFFIISFFLCYLIINIQSNRSLKSAEQIISFLEKYKDKNGAYPTKIVSLTPDYLKKIPRQWFMLTSRDYRYSYDSRNKVFSIERCWGVNVTHIWISGSNEWQFVD